MKKLTSLFIVTLIVFSLICGCSEKPSEQPSDSNALESNTPSSTNETGNEPEETLFPFTYVEKFAFADFDVESVDKIILSNHMGDSKELIGEDLKKVIDFLKGIEGTDPKSAIGYVDHEYRVKMYVGDKLMFDIFFMGQWGFTAGEYEIVNNFTYPAIYNMSTATHTEVNRFFSEFFK